MDLINPWEVMWTLISFAIFAFLLARIGFRPLLKLLDERRETIQSSLEEAQRAREQAEATQREYEARLAAAQREAQQIIDRAQRLAEDEHRTRLEAAQQEAEQLLERARQTIARERDEAIRALRAEVADLTISATERLLRRTLDGEEQRRLAEAAVREVANMQ